MNIMTNGLTQLENFPAVRPDPQVGDLFPLASRALVWCPVYKVLLKQQNQQSNSFEVFYTNLLSTPTVDIGQSSTKLVNLLTA